MIYEFKASFCLDDFDSDINSIAICRKIQSDLDRFDPNFTYRLVELFSDNTLVWTTDWTVDDHHLGTVLLTSKHNDCDRIYGHLYMLNLQSQRI